MGEAKAKAALERLGKKHVDRVIALVELMKDNGETQTPKKLLKHLLAQEPEDVDFTPLEDQEKRQRKRQELRLQQEEHERVEAESQRKFDEARAVIDATPEADRDAWRRLLAIKFPGKTWSKDDLMGSLTLVDLMRATPDLHAALAEAEAELQQSRAALKAMSRREPARAIA
jgi:hypothetical protein